jgi:aldehyde dehydrogenase (NAD+)
MTAFDTPTLGRDAQRLISEPSLLIGGARCEGSGEPLECVDPFTGESLGAIATAGSAQVDAAITSARKAFDSGPWGRLSPDDRSRLLLRAVEAFSRHRDALVELMVAETGCPISLSRSLQVDAMLDHLAWFADAARRGPRGGFERELPPHSGPPLTSRSLLVHEPVGVVVAITPYNIPLLTAVWKVAAALASGCTAVLVPSPSAALVSLAWSRVLLEADLPDGAVSFLVGGAEVGRALSESPRVDMVTFTGSNVVGRHVMRQAAANFKRIVLELGGKSPNLLLPGADIDAAVSPSLLRFCRNAGQACGATTRTFVPRDEYDRYVATARDCLGDVVVGDPWDERTVVGPLISAEHRARVEGYVERSLANGAVIEAGGGRPAFPSGAFMNPSLIGRVDNHAEIARDELFGPVGIVLPYDSVDEGISMANDSRYGLNANIWGPHRDALATARRIRSGTVTINGGGGLRADAPFGGYRESGIGREAGEEGFAEFFEVKQLQWPT